MIKRYAIFAVILIIAVAVATAMKKPVKPDGKKGDNSKYIKFSHTFHVKENGIACEDCHLKAKESVLSSDNLLGDHQSCQTCHEEQINGNATCNYCHTDQDNIIPIENKERELIFSHQLHTSTLNLKCESCHTGVDTVAYVSADNMPAMSSCIDCHTQKNVSTNCQTCHTDFVSLIPADHLAGDFQKRHKEQTRIGMMDVSCNTCHSESSCQDCHSGTELQGFGLRKDLMAEPSPRTSIKDSPKQLRLQQVHSLDYRFTHGIDARSKASECASCHEAQTFCAECHEAGGNINQQKFKPASHAVAGFTTLGKGSGGGRHAELARRDIESCISCHDVQGNDPTCMMCHNGDGGIR